jgi:signal transduction histidine kinase
MWGFLFIAIVLFALYQRRRYRMRCDCDKEDYWFRRGSDRAEHYAHRFEAKAAKFERKLRERIERESRRGWRAKAARFERETRERFEREPDGWKALRGLWRDFGSASRAQTGTEAAPHPAPGSKPESGGEQPFKTEQERQAYERARKRAAAEAGFYVHLMWYGTVIGFLFLINLMTGSYPWFLWPAIGWGFGLASHFSAVFGWHWIHERVFQPAIQREVQREVQQEKEVLRTEKQASLDQLTASFAHEIRNPIAAAKSLVQQMGEDPTSVENVEYAKVALDELARVERSVSHLLKYAKEEDYHFDNVNLASVLDGALTQMRAKLEAAQVTVSRHYLSGPTVRADADKLRQVFVNVIDNAIDAMGSTTAERKLELSILSGLPASATVRIRDNGCGIAADKLSKIFNPFFTSKQNGTGLGMAIAKKVIDSHSGRIEVTSKVGEGTEFAITLPLADATRAERPATPAAPKPAPSADSAASNTNARTSDETASVQTRAQRQ